MNQPPQQPLPPGFLPTTNPLEVGIRRSAQLYNAPRTASQMAHDRGMYIRQPVGPVEYAEGNIKKSRYNTGLAGYNQRMPQLTDNPDDMSGQEYMANYAQSMPEAAREVQKATMNPQQTFNQNKLPPAYYDGLSGNMATNLLQMAKMKKAQRGA